MPSAPPSNDARKLTLRCQFCETWNRVEAARATDRPMCGKCSKPMLLDRPYVLTDESFARTVAEAEVPVLVDFYADWCGPCKQMAPTVDQLAAKHQGTLLVAKLNTDKAPITAKSHQVQGIPTVIVFDHGLVVARQSGVLPLAVLEQLAMTPHPGSPEQPPP